MRGGFCRSDELDLQRCWRGELGWLRLCGLGPQGGSDWVEIDENGGPEGLQGGFSSSEVAALASVVAMDEESEQALDAWPDAVLDARVRRGPIALVVRLGAGPRGV